ncbi:MAG: cell division protein ZapE [Actinomycetota bacterium]|jgi:cell division protein ZapE
MGAQLSEPSAVPKSLIGIAPEISTQELMRQLQPPPEFFQSRFENYRPDPQFPSQQAAVERSKQFVTGPSKKLFSKAVSIPGVYLDGGFGVGKTHLLASIWHAFSGPKAFGSFLEYTSLVGYLGFAEAVNQFSRYGLICIDEFELDDPGDTMLMSRFLKELSAKGIKFAATSNTPPNALGQGRFAAEDFKREIQGLGERFEIVSVDGEDYRHRDSSSDSRNLSTRELADWISYQSDPYQDRFSDLLQFLGTLHPTKFRRLLVDVGALAIHDVFQLEDQVAALRLVSFIDRLYEQQIPLRTSGDLPATKVFSKTMIEGGYRKKYLRAISRIGALCELY